MRNGGDAPVSGVRVRDDLPAGLRTLAGEFSVAIQVGTIQPGEAQAFPIQVRAAGPGEYVNTATATADHGLVTVARSKTVVAAPALVVYVALPPKPLSDLLSEYTIQVSNKGAVAARRTVLTCAVPADASRRAGIGAGGGAERAQGGKVTWRLGDLGPGESRGVTLTAKASSKGQAPGAVMPIPARRDTQGTDPGAPGRVEGVCVLLLECVGPPAADEVGQEGARVITVTNQGTTLATGLGVQCTLPAQSRRAGISAKGPTKHTAQGKTVAFAPLKALAAGQKATYRLNVKALEAGESRFKISLTCDQLTSPVQETVICRIGR